MGIADHFTCLLRNLYAGQEATVRTLHGTMNWLKIGKWVYEGCILPPCLFNLYEEYIWAGCEVLDWMKNKLDSRLLGEISTPSDTQTIPLWWQSEEELKNLSLKVKEDSEKAGLNSTFKKLRSWHPVPSLHSKYMGKKWKQWLILFSWVPK